MPVKYEYHLSFIPEGYQELNVIEKVDGKVYLYVNNLGQILQFTYTDDTTNNSLFTKAEDYQQYSAFVNECPADIYIALKENETSVIVWQDVQAGVLYQIFAFADQTELINIAEMVEKIVE